jgi:hypothetical protein
MMVVVMMMIGGGVSGSVCVVVAYALMTIVMI